MTTRIGGEIQWMRNGLDGVGIGWSRLGLLLLVRRIEDGGNTEVGVGDGVGGGDLGFYFGCNEGCGGG